MDLLKENRKIEAKIAQEEERIDKVKRHIVEQKRTTTQVRQDDITMRKDISTYECHVVDHTGIDTKCSSLVN